MLELLIAEHRANEYGWEVANRKNTMFDQEGMEQQDKDSAEKFLKSMVMMEISCQLGKKGRP